VIKITPSDPPPPHPSAGDLELALEHDLEKTWDSKENLNTNTLGPW
jgi:hypothetical protein